MKAVSKGDILVGKPARFTSEDSLGSQTFISSRGVTPLAGDKGLLSLYRLGPAEPGRGCDRVLRGERRTGACLDRLHAACKRQE